MRAEAPRTTELAVAASGGGDSTALLHCTASVAKRLGLHVHALHVHHGLQASADGWVRQLRRQVSRWQCEGLPVSLHVHRLAGAPARGDSVEAWARRERYAALSAMAHEHRCSLLLLAHHRRDQAETFLLQALRGGGAAGLAAMPAAAERDGLWWCRPWLAQPREAIESYRQQHGLTAVHDPSNTDPRLARGRLRGAPWQGLLAGFADAETTLAAAALRASSEAAALREWTAEALSTLGAGDALPVAPWLLLSPAKREQVLRAWLQRAGSLATQNLVTRLLAELPIATSAEWPDGTQHGLMLHRGRLQRVGVPHHRPHTIARAAVDTICDLSRPGDHRVPGWSGAMRIEHTSQGGIDAAALRLASLRARRGGEQFQLAPNRPARSLKKQFQALGVPASKRDGPLVFVGSDLVFVPGLGIDARWLALHRAAGDSDASSASVGVSVTWLPDAMQAPSTQG